MKVAYTGKVTAVETSLEDPPTFVSRCTFPHPIFSTMMHMCIHVPIIGQLELGQDVKLILTDEDI